MTRKNQRARPKPNSAQTDIETIKSAPVTTTNLNPDDDETEEENNNPSLPAFFIDQPVN